jgi:hypothetical protein
MRTVQSQYRIRQHVKRKKVNYTFHVMGNSTVGSQTLHIYTTNRRKLLFTILDTENYAQELVARMSLLNETKIMDTHLCRHSRNIHLGAEFFWDKSCKEKGDTHFMHNRKFCLSQGFIDDLNNAG